MSIRVIFAAILGYMIKVIGLECGFYQPNLQKQFFHNLNLTRGLTRVWQRLGAVWWQLSIQNRFNMERGFKPQWVDRISGGLTF